MQPCGTDNSPHTHSHSLTPTLTYLRIPSHRFVPTHIHSHLYAHTPHIQIHAHSFTHTNTHTHAHTKVRFSEELNDGGSPLLAQMILSSPSLSLGCPPLTNFGESNTPAWFPASLPYTPPGLVKDTFCSSPAQTGLSSQAGVPIPPNTRWSCLWLPWPHRESPFLHPVTKCPPSLSSPHQIFISYLWNPAMGQGALKLTGSQGTEVCISLNFYFF